MKIIWTAHAMPGPEFFLRGFVNIIISIPDLAAI